MTAILDTPTTAPAEPRTLPVCGDNPPCGLTGSTESCPADTTGCPSC